MVLSNKEVCHKKSYKLITNYFSKEIGIKMILKNPNYKIN